MRRICLGLAVIGAAAVLAATALAASAPHDQLTHQEYTLLKSAETRYQQGLAASKANWSGLTAICKSLGSATTLLATQQASCLAETALLEGLALFPAAENKCGTSQPYEWVCLQPRYTALAVDAGAMYMADTTARQAAVKRGFSGVCLATLTDTLQELDQQHQLAVITNKLANDMKLIVEVAKGQKPASAMNVSKVGHDANVFETDADNVLNQGAEGTLGDCRHR